MKTNEYFKKGIQHYENGNYDGAISDYTKAVQSYPSYVSAWCNRELVLEGKENLANFKRDKASEETVPQSSQRDQSIKQGRGKFVRLFD